MVTRSLLYGFATLCALISSRQDWTANGASACEKYLTPEVVSTIMDGPAEQPKQDAANSCHRGSLYVTLSVRTRDVEEFRREIPRIADAHPLSGVGDAAYWNGGGATTAVKGRRECVISVLVPQFAKIHNAELGQKFGEICNTLLALP